MDKDIKEYLEQNEEAKEHCEKILDEYLETNDGLRKCLNKIPKKENYIFIKWLIPVCKKIGEN